VSEGRWTAFARSPFSRSRAASYLLDDSRTKENRDGRDPARPFENYFAWGEKRNAYRILVGMPKGKRPLGRPRRRWLDNIGQMDLREIGWNGMDWIDLAQNRDKWRALVNTVMNLRVP
jgi:hypothetical protein